MNINSKESHEGRPVPPNLLFPSIRSQGALVFPVLKGGLQVCDVYWQLSRKESPLLCSLRLTLRALRMCLISCLLLRDIISGLESEDSEVSYNLPFPNQVVKKKKKISFFLLSKIWLGRLWEALKNFLKGNTLSPIRILERQGVHNFLLLCLLVVRALDQWVVSQCPHHPCHSPQWAMRTFQRQGQHFTFPL